LAAELYSKWELELSNKNADDLNISDSLFNELISDYSTTGYAKIALLKQASININNKNFDNALNQYLTLIDLTDGFKGNKLFNKIARINSARLYYNQEQYTEALLLLEKYSTSSTDAIIHELIGDILKKQEKYDLAKDQYLRAKEKYNENLSLSIINMKLTSVE
jgi:predicted negative regulator of RcsB-dependent stress response